MAQGDANRLILVSTNSGPPHCYPMRMYGEKRGPRFLSFLRRTAAFQSRHAVAYPRKPKRSPPARWSVSQRADILAEARRVLDALDGTPRPLNDLAGRAGLPAWTLRRTLAALVGTGWPVSSVDGPREGRHGAPPCLYRRSTEGSDAPRSRRVRNLVHGVDAFLGGAKPQERVGGGDDD